MYGGIYNQCLLLVYRPLVKSRRGAGVSMVDTGRGRKGPLEGRTPGAYRDLVAGIGRQMGVNTRGKAVAG